MPKITLVGDFYSVEEAREATPFLGTSGWCLNKMLEEAGIHRADCMVTNVLNLPARDIEDFCASKSDGVSHLGPLKSGKYLRPEFLPELERLEREIVGATPNIVIALGGTAAWAILGSSAISSVRGTITLDKTGRRKCLPTYHPKVVLADWSQRHVTVLDLAKAGRDSDWPEVRRPERTVYIEPVYSDLEWFFAEHLVSARSIAFDIETAGDQITCIGFAPTRSVALVVPFRDNRQQTRSYWPTVNDERLAWDFVRRILALPIPKFGQNTLYDINFLWAKYGIPIVNYAHDTMLLHHALQPESQKGLGFLGSVYTQESSWKLLNRKKATIKRDA